MTEPITFEQNKRMRRRHEGCRLRAHPHHCGQEIRLTCQTCGRHWWVPDSRDVRGPTCPRVGCKGLPVSGVMPTRARAPARGKWRYERDEKEDEKCG